MLPRKLYIYQPTLVSGDLYNFTVYFSDPSSAKYFNLGDVVQDTAQNVYQIVAPTVIPLNEGNLIQVKALTNNVPPVEDTYYNSLIYTPNQVDVRPKVSTSGAISNITTYDGPNFEYQLLSGWVDASQSDLAIVGDSIVDLSGKEFKISYIGGSRFSDFIRVVEALEEGIPPIQGDATLFRSSSGGYYQGTRLTDAARTVARNRDFYLLDKKVQEVESLITNPIITTLDDKDYLNNTGSVLSKSTPVFINSDGNLEPTDITDPLKNNCIGLLVDDVSILGLGTIRSRGRLSDVTVTGDFNDEVFVGSGGLITDPTFNEGERIICIGIIVPNRDNPILKDILIDIDFRGYF